MAVMRGCDGELKVDSTKVTYIDSFSISLNTGTTEVSQLGSEWKEFMATTKDWSGSASGTLDTADATQEAFLDDFLASGQASVEGIFKVAADYSLKGNMLATGLSIQASHGDKISISFNFQGTGALSKAS